MFKKNAKLSPVNRKYCSCLVKVRSKKISNPYGICTKSIFGSRNLKKNTLIRCTKSYDIKKFKKDQIIYLLREKGLMVTNRITKAELVNMFNKEVISKDTVKKLKRNPRKN